MRILVECLELWGTDYNRFSYSERRGLASMGRCLHKAGFDVTYWSLNYNGVDSVGMKYNATPIFKDYDLIVFQNPVHLFPDGELYTYAVEGGKVWFRHFALNGNLQKGLTEFVELIDTVILPNDGELSLAVQRFPYLASKSVSWIPPVPSPSGRKKLPCSYIYPANPVHFNVHQDPLHSIMFLRIAEQLYNLNNRSRFFISRGFPGLWGAANSWEDSYAQQQWARETLERAFIIKNLEIWSCLDYDYFLDKIEASEMMLVIRNYYPGTVYVMLEGIALGCAVVCKGIPYLKEEWTINLDENLFWRHVSDDTEEKRIACVNAVVEAVNNFHDSDKSWVQDAQAEVLETFSEKNATDKLLQWL